MTMIGKICCYLVVIWGRFHVDFIHGTLLSDQYLRSDDAYIHTYGARRNYNDLPPMEADLNTLNFS